MHSEPAPSERTAVLVGVALPDDTDASIDESLTELSRLCKTLGIKAVHRLSQRRPSLSGGTVLGEGKLKELARLTGGSGVVPKKAFAKKTKAALRREEEAAPDEEEEPLDDDEVVEANEPVEKVDTVVFDCDLSPSQLSNLEKATGAQVLDRTGVIVEIFSRHARTREARLQVEIARLKYLAPRIRKTGTGGGDRLGMAGESTLELDRRKIRDRISELKDEIARIQREQADGRSQRAEENCVALVGYTNAGKSSLMRALTGSQVLVEDKLFATLDTTVRTLSPPTVPPILISDTVGFIKKLPHDLVASFRSTLEEAGAADLLLFVVDASDPSFRSQLQVTHDVLASIGVEDIASRLVLNKCDKLPADEVEALAAEFPDAVRMSAKRPEDVAALRGTLIAFFESGMVEEEIFVPYTAPRGVGRVRAAVRVTGERHDENGTWLTVRAHTADVVRLRESLAP